MLREERNAANEGSTELGFDCSMPYDERWVVVDSGPSRNGAHQVVRILARWPTCADTKAFIELADPADDRGAEELRDRRRSFVRRPPREFTRAVRKTISIDLWRPRRVRPHYT